MHGSLFIPTRGVRLRPTSGFRRIPTGRVLEDPTRGVEREAMVGSGQPFLTFGCFLTGYPYLTMDRIGWSNPLKDKQKR